MADRLRGPFLTVLLGALTAMAPARASVPGAFAPVEIEGRLLVDGGITNNLPVDVAREMGADLLIVVTISTGLKGPEELQSVLGIVGQLSTLLTYRGTAQQLETLGPQDILSRTSGTSPPARSRASPRPSPSSRRPRGSSPIGSRPCRST